MTQNGPPACFAKLLRQAAFNRQLVEEAAEVEMTAILREFAEEFEEFLRGQECEAGASGDISQ
jgi:hypothetical protein